MKNTKHTYHGASYMYKVRRQMHPRHTAPATPQSSCGVAVLRADHVLAEYVIISRVVRVQRAGRSGAPRDGRAVVHEPELWLLLRVRPLLTRPDTNHACFLTALTNFYPSAGGPDRLRARSELQSGVFATSCRLQPATAQRRQPLRLSCRYPIVGYKTGGVDPFAPGKAGGAAIAPQVGTQDALSQSICNHSSQSIICWAWSPRLWTSCDWCMPCRKRVTWPPDRAAGLAVQHLRRPAALRVGPHAGPRRLVPAAVAGESIMVGCEHWCPALHLAYIQPINNGTS
jgi:hypothetical protein